MRFFRIFLLYFQTVLEYRGRSFVSFLIAFLIPGTMILFWNGATQSKGSHIQFSTIASYYLLLIPIGVALTSHVEEDIAREDIQEGSLVKYLTKPFSYYWIKFYQEIPFRIIQGFFGVIAVACIALLIPALS